MADRDDRDGPRGVAQTAYFNCLNGGRVVSRVGTLAVLQLPQACVYTVAALVHVVHVVSVLGNACMLSSEVVTSLAAGLALSTGACSSGHRGSGGGPGTDLPVHPDVQRTMFTCLATTAGPDNVPITTTTRIIGATDNGTG